MSATSLFRSSVLVLVLLTVTTITSWAEPCSLQTIKGTYVALEQGWLLPPAAPGASPAVLVVNVTFDGKGNMSGTYSGNFGPDVFKDQTFSGTYNVTADCEFTDAFTPQPFTDVVLHQTGFISGEGILQEAHYIYTDDGRVVSGTAKKKGSSPEQAR